MYIWQTKTWSNMLIKSKQVEKIIELDWIQIEKRKISLWQFWLFIIWIKEEELKKIYKLEKELKKLCKKEKCLFIQIETLNYNQIKEKNIKWFKNSYYKKFITPYTAIINLKQDEEEILKQMKPKGRYNIKLAWKKWIVVKKVEKNIKNIEIFYNLIWETTKRNKFYWNSLKYYQTFLEEIKNSELLFAYYEDKVIASWIFIFDKEVSIYYYWASTSEAKYRNLMAPFLLQWEAIKFAKKSNSKIYDFLWIADPNKKNSSLKWVTDFKLKLTKESINVSSSYIYIHNKIIFYIIKLLRSLKSL